MRLTLHIVLCVLAFTPVALAADAGPRVPRWHRFEAAFESDKKYKKPAYDVQMTVELTAPSGQTTKVDAFWDGGKTFKVRFSPDEIGQWRYVTRASDEANAGLHGKTGSFACVTGTSKNHLYAKGPIRLSEDRHHFVYADGTPFFWLGDTAWNAPLLSTEEEWKSYLRERKAKRFNVVQLIPTQSLIAGGDATGRQAFYRDDKDNGKLVFEPAFWRRLDARFDAANEEGFIVAPSFTWASKFSEAARAMNPGATMSEDQLVVLLRYAQARFGAHHLVWLFGGDIDYTREEDRWRRIGRRVFSERPRKLVSMHPAPPKIFYADFKDEPWLGFIGYQSSHSNSPTTLKIMTEGEPTKVWKMQPRFPIVNIEPNYEGHHDWFTKGPFNAYHVRRAAYWSLLGVPTAGVSYGAHGVWSWESTANVPMSHPDSGEARPWREAIKLPGSAHMKVLADVLTAAGRPWWQLRPAPELVLEQPGNTEAGHFVTAAQATDGRLLVVYFPAAGSVPLNLSGVAKEARASWIDPTTGRAQPARIAVGEKVTVTPPAKNAAGDSDFLLLLEAAGAGAR